MSRFRKIIIKIDEKREVFEDFLAEKVLENWDNYSHSDDLREAFSYALITAVNAYLSTYGVPQVPDNIKRQMAKRSTIIYKRLNKKLQKQLKKKSKLYLQNHTEVEDDWF